VQSSGGVVANTRLRRLMGERAARSGLELLVPSPELCTDNAAMIAAAGFKTIGQPTKVDPSLSW